MKIGLTEARIQVSADTPTFYFSLLPSLLAWPFSFAHPGTTQSLTESDKANSFLTLLSRFYARFVSSLKARRRPRRCSHRVPSFSHSANTAIIELTHASVIIRQHWLTAAITARSAITISPARGLRTKDPPRALDLTHKVQIGTGKNFQLFPCF